MRSMSSAVWGVVEWGRVSRCLYAMHMVRSKQSVLLALVVFSCYPKLQDIVHNT